MKKILLLIVLCCSMTVHAQTDEQLMSWLEKGRTALEQHNYPVAIQYMEMMRDGYGKRISRTDNTYAVIANELAQCYYRSGNYPMAVERKTEALNIMRQAAGADKKEYAVELGYLANYCSQAGDNERALEIAGQAVDIIQGSIGKDNETYATLLGNMALYHDRSGNHVKALETGTEAMRIKRKVLGKSHPEYAVSLLNMGSYNAHLGNYNKGIELASSALDIFRKNYGDNHQYCATALDNIAAYLSEFGQYDKAVEFGTWAANIFKNVYGDRHPEYATALGNLAAYYGEEGRYDMAVDLAAQAVEIFIEKVGVNHPTVALLLDNSAGYYAHAGNNAKALEMGELSAQLYEMIYGTHHPDYAIALSNLAGYARLNGDMAKCLDNFRKSTDILQEHVMMQFASLAGGRRTNFWDRYAYLFTIIYPSIVYQSHATTAPDLYDKSCLFAKGLLLSTELELKKLIQESGDQEAMSMLDDLQQEQRKLKSLAEIPAEQRYANVDSLLRVVNRKERQLIQRSKAYGNFTERIRTSWRDIQRVLKNDEVAIEFLSFDEWGTGQTVVAALTLRKDDKEPHFIPLFKNNQLTGVSDPQYFYCDEVTQLVWQPLQQQLKGVRRIFFSPAGVLHNIGIEYAPGMEQYEMMRLSSTREVIDMNGSAGKDRSVKKGSVLASLFGGVDYTTLPNAPSASGTAVQYGSHEESVERHRALVDSLNLRGMSAKYLPATLTEVETINSSFEKKHIAADMHTGKAATETALKAMSGHVPRMLHIATHGFYFTEKQMNNKNGKLSFYSKHEVASAADFEDKALSRSGLLFAGANAAFQGRDIPMGTDDGVLTANEIAQLDLRGLDLVVLSACKTGNGDVNQGEGVYGLQRGFKKAGAQTLVMSLWEVADEATQILMTSFYDNLLLGQSRREAFRHAQQHLREVENGQFNHPQFWAAFVMLD